MKRGIELGLNTIIILVIGVIVAAVLLIFFGDTVKSVFGSLFRIADVANSSSVEVAEDTGSLLDRLKPETGWSMPWG